MEVKMKRKKLKAFTLIELVIVLVIISILLAVAIPSINKYKEKAQGTADNMNMLALKEAATMYCIENGWDDKTDFKEEDLAPFLESSLDDSDSTSKAKKLLAAYSVTIQDKKVIVKKH